MIITTTPSIEGHTILEYRGIVFGEVVEGVSFFKDLGSSIRDVFGGRSAGYENQLNKSRQEALRELEANAVALGANAVVGLDFDYEVLGEANGMLMVNATGTAVLID